jgi:hypothetical protein
MDPNAAMGVQANQLGMQTQRQNLAFDAEKMQMVRNQAKEQAAAQAAALDAAAVTSEIEETKRTMAGAAPLMMAWKQGDPAAGQALVAYLARNGIQVTADNIEPTLYALQGGLEGLTAGLDAMKAQQGLMPEAPSWSAATQDQAAQYGAAGGQINSQTGEFKPINPPSGGIQFDPETGRVLSIGGKPGDVKPATEAEAKNAGFLVRMRSSQTALNDLESQGTDLGAALLNKDPTGLANYAQSPEYQLYDQAKRDFVNALLRRESGAVIAPSEFANAEAQYFPRPGDSPEVIAQKRKNRDNAIAGVTVGAGNSATNPLISGTAETGTDFGNMELTDLVRVDVTQLTSDQIAAFMARMQEVGQ